MTIRFIPLTANDYSQALNHGRVPTFYVYSICKRHDQIFSLGLNTFLPLSGWKIILNVRSLRSGKTSSNDYIYHAM